MKWLTTQCLLAGVAFSIVAPAGRAAAPGEVPAAAAKPEVMGRVHFAGWQEVSADSGGHTFKEIWNLPASADLRNEVCDKLAAAVAARFESKGNDRAASCAALIRPLLNDFCQAEFYAEAIARPENVLDVALALRLDPDRMQVWEKNWSQLLAGWKLRTGAGPAQLTYQAAHSWFALRCVSGTGPLDSSTLPPSPMIARIQQGQRPGPPAEAYWLKLTADLPAWAQRFSHRRDNLPRLDLTVAGRKENLRSEALLTFRDPVAPRVEKWDVPIATLRDPLISFTALQGMAPWLKKQPLVQELGLDKVPNQLFLWALSQTVFQIQGAVPMADPPRAFQSIGTHWVPGFNRVLDEYAVGKIERLTNRVELMWRGLPILVPYLRPVQDGNKGYLHGGIFPVAPPTNPPPQQLIQQLNSQTNVLYYDWEITQARLNQLRPLLQLASVFLTVSPMSTNSAASKWLDAIEPRLGNTVTEVTVASPRELTFVRTSPVGLNGLELLTMANWVQGTNFPRLDFKLNFRPVIRSKGQEPAK